MAATATAPKTRGRSAPARRPEPRRAPSRRPAPRRAPARRRQATPIPGRLIPLAVGRTAGAVGGLADSGLVVRLTRGRLWIAALAVLLVGIVALNVISLSLSSSSSDTARAVERLETEASTLRADLAKELSSQRVQRIAATLGLSAPDPGSIGYLKPSHGDAAEAARRLRSGELAAVPPPAEPIIDYAAPVAEVQAAPPDAEAATTVPEPAPEAATEAAAAAPVAEAATETAPADAGAEGGIAAP